MNRVWRHKLTILLAIIMLAGLMPVSGPTFANKYLESETVVLTDTTTWKSIDYTAVSLILKGEDLFSDTPGILEKNSLGEYRTLVPISAVFNALDVPYEWIGSSREVAFVLDGKNVVIQIDNPYASVDGERVYLPNGIAPRIFNYQGVDRTYVPVRFIVELMGLDVAWIPETRTVAINNPEQTLTGGYLNYKGQYPEIRFKITGKVDATSYVIRGTDLGGQDQTVVDIQNTKMDIGQMGKDWTLEGSKWIYDISDNIFGIDTVELAQTEDNPYTTRVIINQEVRRGHDFFYDSETGEFVIRMINTVDDVIYKKIYATDTVVIKTSENPSINQKFDGDKIVVDVLGSYLHINDGIAENIGVNQGKIRSVAYEQIKVPEYENLEDVTRLTVQLTEPIAQDQFYVEIEGGDIYVYVTETLINNFEYVKNSNESARLDIRLFEETAYDYVYNESQRLITFSLPLSTTDLGSFDYPVNDAIIESLQVVETEDSYDVIIRVGENTEVSNISTKEYVSLTFVNTQIRDSEFKEKLVVIDAGHGGRDPGAVGSLVYEKDVNLKTAIMLQSSLEQLGFKVYMTRSKDEYVNLYDRAGMANGLGADIFVSIHANAHTKSATNGVEVLYASDAMSAGKGLATEIQNELIKSLGAVNRGIVKRPNLVVLRETAMPAVLVELGFLTNAAEQQKLMDDTYLKRAADAIARGLVDFLD
ncbi:N-acetylmuramoyl-L-alanine amidase [Fusibacter tunisiensis]|uniref:N-acetylmuramoyl-L-alanine amidase n=1 Tax=Fusibacter tunisiensis TaxID=1008308 RepID=A0ABS2MSE3_9FIRM|nr:N-acetylmuramoyl-L-alanine amidase [Fusibacter tunisiensis]MBM7562323.1 N-acetylmuramoyl-L-alanine amidase [Fusibacter tunisiensis]